MRYSYLLLLVALVSTSASAQKADKLDKQGNRGARGIMPENTVRSMLKALDLGVNTLFMNVVITGDKKVVLSHTPYFNNDISLTPEGKPISFKDEKKYNIYKMDYEQVQKFDVGSKVNARFPGQQKFRAHKPLLEDVIDSVQAYVKANKLPKPNYHIELKAIPKGANEFHPEPAEFADLVMEVINNKKLSKLVTISSFEVASLQHLHQEYPKVKTGLLIDEKKDFEKNIEELGFNPSVYLPYSVLVGKGLVDRCHKAGIKIIPWTVNTVKDMNYLIDLGVDGIITDYPNLFGLLNR
jgi:glycerophosphoryl diester phosphodiesterase